MHHVTIVVFPQRRCWQRGEGWGTSRSSSLDSIWAGRTLASVWVRQLPTLIWKACQKGEPRLRAAHEELSCTGGFQGEERQIWGGHEKDGHAHPVAATFPSERDGDRDSETTGSFRRKA